IRPEHLVLDAGGFEVTAEVVEPLGADTLVTARVATSDVVVTARLAGETEVVVGDPLRFGFDPRHAILLDPASGQRVRA
ncbi:MAG: TOBE domain-containing protein, partial [Alphaproteobacteria bacterium]|nr:TOBE domain-containing protein [Alphaproteobacteria bacterium]